MRNLIIIIMLLSAYLLHSATISGNVSNNYGESILEAYVDLITIGGFVYFSGYTDDYGNFSMEEITPGEYYLSVWASGYLTYYYENASGPEDATILALEEETTIEGLEIVLLEPEIFEVTGIVLNVDTGEPIENAEVWAMISWERDDDPLRENTAFTDENGEYSLEIFTGDYYFNAFAENYNPQFYDHRYSWQDADIVTINSDTENINFDLTIITVYENSFYGTVTTDDDEPVQGALILVLENWDGHWVTVFEILGVTGENGQYLIENIEPGERIISCLTFWGMPPIFYENTYDIEEAFVFDILEDSNFEANFTFTEPEIYSVSGVVLDDETGDPLAGAEVWAIGSEFGRDPYEWNVEPFTTTDENGEYTLSIFEGEYWIECWSNEYFPQWYDHHDLWDNSDVVVVNEDLENVDFDLTPIESQFLFYISGNVTINGDVPSQCTVIVVSSDEDWDNVDQTESTGGYEIGVPEPGDYYVYAYTNSSPLTYYNDVYNFENATLINVEQDVQNIDFDLQYADLDGYITLNGFVYNQDDEPLRNTSIVILNAADEPDSYAMTNNNGYFNSINITPGNYLVLATKIFHYSDSEYLAINQNGSIDFYVNANNSFSSSGESSIIEPNDLLLCNFPNPFNPVTTIYFSSTHKDIENTEIIIFNLKGQKIKTLSSKQISTPLSSQIHQISWDGTDENNESVTSGIYFYKLSIGGKPQAVRKCILMK